MLQIQTIRRQLRTITIPNIKNSSNRKHTYVAIIASTFSCFSLFSFFLCLVDSTLVSGLVHFVHPRTAYSGYLTSRPILNLFYNFFQSLLSFTKSTESCDHKHTNSRAVNTGTCVWEVCRYRRIQERYTTRILSYLTALALARIASSFISKVFLFHLSHS